MRKSYYLKKNLNFCNCWHLLQIKYLAVRKYFRGVWGDDVVVGDRTIDVHVRKIREKIGIDNIKTVKGVGYKFDA